MNCFENSKQGLTPKNPHKEPKAGSDPKEPKERALYQPILPRLALRMLSGSLLGKGG